MKFTQRLPQKKKYNSADSHKAPKQLTQKTEQNILGHDHENEFWKKVKQEEELRQQHVALLLATPGCENLTQQEAQDQVETMLRYVTLLYELVVTEE